MDRAWTAGNRAASRADIPLEAQVPPAADIRDVAVDFVTTDPARATPAHLRQWLANFDRSFVGLTGSRTAIIQAQRQVGAPPSVTEPLAKGSYGVDHGA